MYEVVAYLSMICIFMLCIARTSVGTHAMSGRRRADGSAPQARNKINAKATQRGREGISCPLAWCSTIQRLNRDVRGLGVIKGEHEIEIGGERPARRSRATDGRMGGGVSWLIAKEGVPCALPRASQPARARRAASGAHSDIPRKESKHETKPIATTTPCFLLCFHFWLLSLSCALFPRCCDAHF